jgi:SAM-dependent methyltransferase
LPGALVSGADVSSESRRQAKQRCPSAEVFELDLQAADFESAQAARIERFDLVVCSEVLEHLPDDALAVSRLKRLLSPSGVMIVTVPGGKKSRFDELIGHLRHYGKRELSLLFTTQGLRSELLWAWGFPFHNAYRTAVRVASRFAFSQPGPTATPGSRSPIETWLARGYELCGRALLPLYYANRPYWGEQLIAVVRRA